MQYFVHTYSILPWNISQNKILFSWFGSNFEFCFSLTLSNSTNLQPLFKGWMQCVYWKYKYETFLDINVTFIQVENAWNISYHVKLYVNVSTWVLGLQTKILEISWDAFYWTNICFESWTILLHFFYREFIIGWFFVFWIINILLKIEFLILSNEQKAWT
jgi:hypothetical protein